MPDDAPLIDREWAAIRELRAAARGRRFRRSRLDRYRAELVERDNKGWSWRDLAEWLRRHKRVKVHPTTIGRRLAQWARQAVPPSAAGGA